MKKLISAALLLCLLLTLGACGASDGPAEAFPFAIPAGYTLTGTGSRNRGILREEDQTTVGGICITDLTARDVRKGAYVRYMDEASGSPLGSEFFAWDGGSWMHPIAYVSQFVSWPYEEEKQPFHRVFFERNGKIYDMWFDLTLIDEETVAELFDPIVETGA